MILSHFLGANLFTPKVIVMKHTEKVKLNEKRPGKKLGCAFCIFHLVLTNQKMYFFGVNTKYISSRSVTALDEICLVFTSKSKYPL